MAIGTSTQHKATSPLATKRSKAVFLSVLGFNHYVVNTYQ